MLIIKDNKVAVADAQYRLIVSENFMFNSKNL